MKTEEKKTFATLEEATSFAEGRRKLKTPDEDLYVSVWWNDGTWAGKELWMLPEGFVPHAVVTITSYV